LKLVAWGEVVRSAHDWAAMNIGRHEFRTRRHSPDRPALGGP
jgi:hypothetical protein